VREQSAEVARRAGEASRAEAAARLAWMRRSWFDG
jgi:hypothetical protein